MTYPLWEAINHNSAINFNKYPESFQLDLVLIGGFGFSPLAVESYYSLST